MLSNIKAIRVILIEDDFDLREGLTDFLNLNNFAVTSVANGAEFERVIVDKVFDIAVVDINLPDTDGFEITRTLARTTNLGVIILTARTQRDDKIKGYSEGANLYLTKPVDGDELVLAIRNLSARIKNLSRNDEKTNRPHWTVDRAGHRLVSPEGTVIKLSGREAKLIFCLADASGQIVPRAVLESALGYNNPDPENRSLDAVLRRLRAKAREARAELPIHVMHAAGFQFSAYITET